MINFTVGPVQMESEIRKIGAEDIPYFRTPEFSEVIFENERLIKKFMHAGVHARCVFLTASGTAAMEAAVMNLFTVQDKILVVNGGSFGERFVKICRIHEFPYTEIALEYGKKLTEEMLKPYENQGYTGFLVNMHETSTGVLYDMELISNFCKRNNLYLVVDAISSFLADPFDMEQSGADIVITGSQKALALPPGVSILVLNKRSVERVEKRVLHSLYFNLKDYLKDGERGQTPYTPAVGIFLQMYKRLQILDKKGIEEEQCRIQNLANDFRERIRKMPFLIPSESLSNAETPLQPIGRVPEKTSVSAYRIFEILKEEYSIFVCPNGGKLAEKIFRVGHIGNLTIEDNETLAMAFSDMMSRGLL